MPQFSIGKHNPRLGEIRRAVREGSLTPEGLLPVEGSHLIAESLASNLEMPELYAREDVAVEIEIVPKGCRAYAVDKTSFQKIQDSETSQGIVGLVRVPSFDLGQILKNPQGPIVVLAALQDPGNVGTILRTAEAFGAAGCIGLDRTVSVYNPKAVRASAGSVFRMPHVWNIDFPSLLRALRAEGIPMVATSPQSEGAIALHDWNWTEPTAVVIGNEGRGVAPAIQDHCDVVLHIPHNPRVESLNSAIAASLVLYEAYRQRNTSGGAR